MLLWLPFAVSAQKKPFTAEQAYEKMTQFAYSNPDSAKFYLHYAIRVDHDAPDSIIARHYNNLGLLHSMNSQRDSAYYYYKKSIAIGTVRNRLSTMVNLAVLYKKERDFKNAVATLAKAINGYQIIRDEKGLGIAYGELGSVYSVMLQRKNAIDYLKRGIAITKKHNLTRQLAIQQQNLATIYFKSNNFQFAKELYEECLPPLEKSTDKLSYAIANANYGSALLSLGQTKQSQKVLELSATLLEPFDDDDLKGIVYGKLADLAVKRNDFKNADMLYKKSYRYVLAAKSPETLSVISNYIGFLNSRQRYSDALKIINTIENELDFRKSNESEKLDFYREASTTLLNTHQDARAVQALKDVIAWKDTVAAIENDQQLKEVEAKYQSEAKSIQAAALKKKNLELNSTANKLAYRNYALLGLFLLVGGAGYYAWNRQRKRIDGNSDEFERLNQLKAQQELELLSARSTTEQHEELIQKQQRELLANSLQQLNYQEQLQQFVSELRQKNEHDSATKLQNLSEQTHWKSFFEKFNAINPHFISKLAAGFPQLNQSELQFCALVRLNLSYKEIGSILQITHQSVFTKKYRVKKKMALEADADFVQFIASL